MSQSLTQARPPQGRKSVKEALQSPAARAAVARSAPPGFDAATALSRAALAVSENVALERCSVLSIIGAVNRAAQLGLAIGGPAGQAYLVPFKGKAQLIVGYRGYIEAAVDGERVLAINASEIRANDSHFSFDLGVPELSHYFDPTVSRGAVTGAYAVAKMANSEKSIAVVTLDELQELREEAKRKSKGRQSPWDTHFGAMAQKTAIRRLAKLLPVSSKLDAITGADGSIGSIDEDVLDVEEVPEGTQGGE